MEHQSQQCVGFLHQVAVTNIPQMYPGCYQNFEGKMQAIIEGCHVNAQVNYLHLPLLKITSDC